MRALFVLAVAWLSSEAVVAQERRPAFVVSQDAGGRPLVGAMVTCFASPALLEAAEDVDVVEGVSDARGRVVVKLLAHRVYSAFAIVPGEGGHYLASEVRENVTAGGEAVLQVVVARRPQRLVVEGEAAWQDIGPLAVDVAPEAHNRLLLRAQARQVPRLPGIGCVVVRDAMGQPLWSQPFSPSHPLVPPGQVPVEELDEVVVRLPPPQELGVRVLDSLGQPVAKASVWQAIEPREGRAAGASYGGLPRACWRPLGCTDSDGVVKVRVALLVRDGRVWDNMTIRAEAAGYAQGVGGVIVFGNAFDGQKQAPAMVDGVLPITLAPMQRLRVHPAGAYEIAIIGHAAKRPTPRSREEGPVHVRTDAAGVAELPLPLAPDAVRVARLQRAGEPPIWSIVATDGVDHWVGAAPPEIRVQVTEADGQPARGRQLVLIPMLFNGPGYELPTGLDQAGRATLRLNGGVWFLWCSDGNEAAWRVVDAAQPLDTVGLQLLPIPRATVRVVDGDGKPRLGARVPFGCGFDWDAQAATVENQFLVYRQMGLLGAAVRQARTDAEGLVHYPVLPLPKARLGFGGAPMGRGRAPGKMVVAAGERVDLVVE